MSAGNALSRRRMMIATLSGMGAALLALSCDDDEGSGSPAPDGGVSDVGAGGSDAELPDAELPDAELPPEVTIPEAWFGLRPALEAWFDGAPEAAIGAVGLAWLRPIDGEQAVIDDLTPLVESALGAGDEAQVLAGFEAGIAEDFDGLSPVSVEGWQLSGTEARLCALVLLLAEEG